MNNIIKSKRVSIDDLFITRNDNGEIEPIEIRSDLFGKNILIKPMTYGYIKRLGIKTDVPAVEWDIDTKLDCLRNHVVDPDLSELTIDDIENRTDPMTIDHFLAMIVVHSVPLFRLRQEREVDIPQLAEAIKQVLGGSQTSNISSTKTDIPT